ncbi:MAG: hypothetical protein IKI84_12255 [Clostridia bacterium]|nr:hypothetical protein [Clostridia bacterium]
MDGRSFPAPDGAETAALREIMDSVPGTAQPPEEVLAAWREGTLIRRERLGRGMTDAEKEHEKNVARFWENALRTHFSSMRRKDRYGLWSVGTAFLTAHFDESPREALIKFRPVLLPGGTGADTSLQPIILLILLPAYAILRFFDVSFLMSHSLMWIVIIAALIGKAKSIRCALLRRRFSDMEALEKSCDVIARSPFRALPPVVWASLALIVALAYFYYLRVM